MTEFNKPRPTPEDEAFNDIERTSKIRQEIIKRQMEPAKTQQQFYDELRNGVIEEVANEVRKMSGFGQDTIDSLTIFIRNLKK
jgi:restriction endonuclease Mrr